jgi:hypothetical protein
MLLQPGTDSTNLTDLFINVGLCLVMIDRNSPRRLKDSWYTHSKLLVSHLSVAKAEWRARQDSSTIATSGARRVVAGDWRAKTLRECPS